MAKKSFPLQFKLFGSSLGILFLLGLIIVATIFSLQSIQKNASDLFNVYGEASNALNDMTGSFYKANSKIQELIINSYDNRFLAASDQVKFDLMNAVSDLEKASARFQKAMPASYQSDTIRKQLETLKPSLEVWTSYLKMMPGLVNSINEFKNQAFDQAHISAFKTLFVSLEVIQTELKTQSKRAYDSIEESNARSLVIFFAVGLLSLLVTIAIILVQNHLIVKPIKEVHLVVKDIAEGEGDLTKKLNSRNNDEIGTLCTNFNVFTEKLSGIISSIEKNMESTADLARTLNSSSLEVSSSLTQISANNQSIHEQITRLHQLLAQAEASIANQSSALAVLDGQIGEQGNMVQESTASITEMMGGIDTVVHISEIRRQAADDLVRSAQTGGSRLDAATAAVDQINNSVTSILGMTKIVASIAAQTSLLAMNAAIEAAHAGEAGAGFSVVADEIRKLSANASQQSKDISAALKGIAGQIQEAWKHSQDTKASFTEIVGGIQEVSRSFDEITANNRELQTSGNLILKTMVGLQDASGIVRRSMDEISTANGTVTDSMAQVQRVSDEVTTGMAEIAEGTNAISQSTHSLSGINRELIAGVEKVRAELGRFKVE